METCAVCNTVFNSPRGLANHYRAKHSLTGEQYRELCEGPKKEAIDFVVCPICGVRRKNLTKHLKFHKMSKEQFLSLYPDQKMVCDTTISKMVEAAKIEYQGRKEEMAHYGSIAITKYNKSADKWSGENGDRLREKISETMTSTLTRLWNTPEYREHISEERSSRFQNKEYAERNSENLKRIWKNPEYIEKMKKRQCCMKDYGNGFRFRSSYEYRLAKMLKEAGVDYQYEPFHVDYNFDGLERRYFPDFYIEKYNLVIEVKPRKFTSEKVNLAKRDSVMSKGYKFMFITEDELELAEGSSTIERVILEAIQG